MPGIRGTGNEFDGTATGTSSAGSRTLYQGWHEVNLPANKAQAMMMLFGSTTYREQIVTRGGYVSAIAFAVTNSGPITAGSITVALSIDGVVQAAQAVGTANDNGGTGKVATFAADTYPVSAGARIRLLVSTSSDLSPASSIEIVASVEVTET